MKNSYICLLFLIIFVGCSKAIAPVDSALDQQILHFGNGSEPQGLDPHVVTGVPEHHLLIAMCEGLTISNPEGGENLAGVAETWDISGDGITYTFNLNKTAKWSNGDALIAEDFVWSWMRILTPSLASQYSDMLYYIEGAEKYYFSKSLPLEALGLLEYILNEKKLSDYHATANTFLNSNVLDLEDLTLKSDIDPKLFFELLEDIEALKSSMIPPNFIKNFIEPKASMLQIIDTWGFNNITPAFNFDEVGVKAIDRHTLIVTLRSPTPFFISLLSHYSTYPVHKNTVLKHGTIDDRRGLWTRPGNFVCNGPMNLKTWELNKQIIVEKNPLYWDADNVRLNEIRYYPVSDESTEDRMFRAGQLHVTNVVPLEKCPVYIADKNPDLRIEPYMGTYFYRVNTKHPVLKDKRVRLALAYALNRKQIVEKVSKCGQAAAYSFTPPGIAGYNPDTSIPFDPELAKSLLAEAGYEDVSTFPVLEILYNTQEGHRKIALAVQQMWEQNLGIKVQLVNQDWKVYLAREMTGDFQISRAGWIGDYEDPNTFLDTLRPNRGNNKTGWENEEYDSLIDTANSTYDQALRYEYLNKAEKLLISEMPIIPIYTYVKAYQISSDVKGWSPNIIDTHHPKYIYLER